MNPTTLVATSSGRPGSLRNRALVAGVSFIAISIVLVAALGSRARQPLASEEDPISQAASTMVTTPPLQQIVPIAVVASSELEGFHAEHLVDGDLESYWNDHALRGVGAELTFEFESPVDLAAVEIVNVHDESTLRRNYRIKAFEIHVGGDVLPIRGQLDDAPEPQRVELGWVAASEVTLHVTSTYPAEPFEGQVPFDELALAEVRFFGLAASS